MLGPVPGCRACGGRLAVTMADLGMQPPSNAFLTSIAEAADEKRYPLRANYVLILPWNLEHEIRRQLAGIAEWGGRFVTPVPLIRVDP